VTANITTRRLSVVMTGDLLGGTTAQELADHIAGTSACESWGVLIPGCPVVQNVTAAAGPDDEVTVTAEFLAHDEVIGGDYKGQEVTEEFVTDYVLGAGEYLVSGGDMFAPYRAQVLRTL
jgi:hypothetical protein